MNRRQFLQGACGSAAALALPGLAPGAGGQEKGRPNFLWISTEDISPDLGCYGDSYAVTPTLDRLASQAVRYTRVFTHAGVCAPSRSGIITGMYPTTIGTHNMRCRGLPPDEVKCFPEYLRAVGYYCTNNVKTDYQFDPPLTAWDECSNRAHWRNRPAGKPFFAVINFTSTHESQIRNRSSAMMKRLASLAPGERHDPARAQLPPYYPDTPAVRQDWAQYYDLITLMDKQVKEVLDQLEQDGLAEDTIVWFWGDHGRGLPRAKRWIYDSGIRVPLIIRVPQKWRKLAAKDSPDAVKPGAVNDDLIAFLDFAPTMLSLAGVEIPRHMQGRAFLGSQKAKPREYIFAARDRMDEAYDLIRAVRDKQYKYIRNYMWYVPGSQDISYMNEMPTMQEMRRLFAEGRLAGPQLQYFEPVKPVEELYDTAADPHEVKNLAGDPKYKDVLARLRRVHNEWCRDTMDVGLIPEPALDEMRWPQGKPGTTVAPVFVKQTGNPQEGGVVTVACATSGASIAYRIGGDAGSPVGWELYTRPVRLQGEELLHAKACRLGLKDSRVVSFRLGDPIADRPQTIPVDPGKNRLNVGALQPRLVKLKELDYEGPNATHAYMEHLEDSSPVVRYWATVGLRASCRFPVDMTFVKPAMQTRLEDPSVLVRIAAAQALCGWGQDKDSLPLLVEALRHPTDKVRMFAIVALDKLGEKARPVLSHIKAMEQDSDDYVKRVAKTILGRLEDR
ncbi:MAG: sulfatase-like hydrolase/transferase [Sedimentisphaerales bacterium]|nr:sulfatase-like hydrolase/transferase [Sedimentisphaerales bacterium]